MRAVLGIVAVGIVALGLWLIASGFVDLESPDAVASKQITSVPGQSTSPVFLGVALLAGGVVLFFLLSRRT